MREHYKSLGKQSSSKLEVEMNLHIIVRVMEIAIIKLDQDHLDPHYDGFRFDQKERPSSRMYNSNGGLTSELLKGGNQ